MHLDTSVRKRCDPRNRRLSSSVGSCAGSLISPSAFSDARGRLVSVSRPSSEEHEITMSYNPSTGFRRKHVVPQSAEEQNDRGTYDAREIDPRAL